MTVAPRHPPIESAARVSVGQFRPRQAAGLLVVDRRQGLAGQDVQVDVQPPTGRGCDTTDGFPRGAGRVGPDRRVVEECHRAIEGDHAGGIELVSVAGAKHGDMFRVEPRDLRSERRLEAIDRAAEQ